MLNRRRVLYPAIASAFAFGAALAGAQEFPSKVVHIVTAQVGGSQDFGARQIAAGISPTLGQQVVVEPRQGGTIGGEIVSKAPPDGYMLFYTGTIFWTLPLLNKNIPYDV